MNNRGIVRVDLQFLAGLLHFPDGHTIIASRPADGFIDAVDLLVDGPTLPDAPECNVTPHVRLQVTVTETETLVRERTYDGKFE